MAIQLGGNGASPIRGLEKAQNALLSSFQRLGTARRINSAADDAAGLAIGQRLQAIESALNQGVRNLNDGISVAQVAEGGLSQTSDSLSRMRELAVQANNGTLNDADRAVIQEEYDQLAAQVTQVSQSTEFNGRSLLNGDISGGGALEFVGGSEGGESVALEVEDSSASSLGIQGRSVFDPGTIDALDSAIDRVSSSRGQIGATINRLGSQVNNELVTQENVAAARSRIEDADIAAEVSERTKNEILLQGQIGLQSQVRLNESAALQLLGN